MKSIFRQSIEITDEQTISARGLTRILAVDDQRGGPEVWYEVDTDKELTEITLWIVGTGHPIPAECQRYGDYIGLFYAVRQTFVGHVYASRIHYDVTS